MTPRPSRTTPLRTTPLRTTSRGVCVDIRLTPNAGRSALGDVAVDAGGTARLTARVTAVPEKGKANKALLKLLAKAWGVSQSRLTIVAGDKDRNKTVLVEGDRADTGRALEEWFNEHND